ncbi:MAG: hypothetical protein KC620_02175 [Myxococcales bacterium]|nr:hypothetical protein [Myxococcales bacterium]
MDADHARGQPRPMATIGAASASPCVAPAARAAHREGARGHFHLDALERSLVCASAERHGLLKVGLALTVRTSPATTIERLTQASRSVQQRHAILRCALRRGEAVGCREPLVLVPDEAVQVTVHRHDRTDAQSWRRAWPDIERTPPPVEASLLTLHAFVGEEHTDIVLVLDHAFCDGMSVAVLGHRLLGALGALEPNGTLAPDDPDAVAQPLALPLSVALAGRGVRPRLQQIWRIIRFLTTQLILHRDPIPFPVADATVPPAEIAAKTGTHLCMAELDASVTARLLARCRAERTTISAIVTAAMILESDERHAERPIEALPSAGGVYARPWYGVSWAVDMRRRRVPPMGSEPLSYQVGSARQFMRSAAALRAGEGRGAAIWQMARDADVHLQTRLAAGDAHAIAALIPHVYARPLPYRGMATIALSNWGVLPIEARYGAIEVRGAQPIVNQRHFRMPLCLASTFQGRLRLSVQFAAPVIAPEPAQAMAEGLVQRLRAAVEAEAST